MVDCGKSYVCCLPWDILVNAVEAGLRLVFAVTGQVEREDSESIRGFGSRRRDLYVLSRKMKKKELYEIIRSIV